MSGHQGWTALRVSIIGLPFEISLTAPLLLSHKGAPTEINLPAFPASSSNTSALNPTEDEAAPIRDTNADQGSTQ